MRLLLKCLNFREFSLFTREFFHLAVQVRGVLFALILLIGLGGWGLAKTESFSFWEGQYLAFISALTIGYGDFTPDSSPGRVICVALGVVGMIWIGLVVGIASVALRRAVEQERAVAQTPGART